jgi:hypothetical protein
MIKVQIINEQRNDSWLESVGIEPEIVQILEDGVVNSKDIVAVSAYFENTQLFMQGGHILLIEENYYTFVKKWIQSTQTTTNREI